MRLKTRLKDLVNAVEQPAKPKQDFTENQEIRKKINEWMKLPVQEFCRSKPGFDMRHGLVLKLLKTSPQRLNNGILTTHDMNYWLRQNKPTPALWIVRLAGEKALVARNEFLRWTKEHMGDSPSQQILSWTKKWGIPVDSYAEVATAAPSSVIEARETYAKRTTKGKARQILGNTLLKRVASTGNGEEVYAFYKSLNKDVVTFQIMFAAMIKNSELLRFYNDISSTMERQEASNNLKVDAKLRETMEVARRARDNNLERGSTRV